MTKFTAENTENLTAAELDMLNAAQDQIQRQHPDADPQNTADRLNNAFFPGISEADLIRAANYK